MQIMFFEYQKLELRNHGLRVFAATLLSYTMFEVLVNLGMHSISFIKMSLHYVLPCCMYDFGNCVNSAPFSPKNHKLVIWGGLQFAGKNLQTNL